MAAALSDPAHGYYSRAEPFGAAGDFITAPEISQCFGELLGLWAAVVWQAMGRPARVLLVELGPGRGTLIADALRAVGQATPDFAAALSLHLVETSHRLRGVQRQTLARAAAGARATWHDAIETLPPGPAILLANELFDALPIRQFQREGDGWAERCVDLDPEAAEDAPGFRFVLRPVAAADMPALGPAHCDAPDGAIVEVNEASRALAAAIAARLAAQVGAALLLDYGPMRSAPGDSLQALRRHAPHPPLADPGEADLTAHVDFEDLATVARAAGGRVFGPVPQGRFLLRLGLGERAAALARVASERQRDAIESGARRLLDPRGMGALFKAMAICHPGLAFPPLPAPPGFDPA
ncbi:MAG: SAM-dependent methyltransferase [Alphaproteobacteria bacterium]|nr:SAM-dependent methyltransferase [Alphaproteobacteria bacterium]